MRIHASRNAVVSILGLLVLLQACGSDTPSGPSVAVTPSPTPTPTATPTPNLGNGLACGAAPMPECGREEGPAGVYGCCRKEGEEGQWETHLWSAIQRLQDEQPGLFDGQRILDRERFIREVARLTEQMFQLCVKPGGPGDEVGVKTGNGFSEQYDIYESNGRLRYPGYQVTCRPARF